MLQALDINNQLVDAKHAKNGKYTCPICSQPVILKKGTFKMAHFAHQSIKDCFMYTYKAETAAHIEGKYALYDLFHPKDCFLEYYLPEIEQIPDCYHQSGVALELQMSVIPVTHIASRTMGYRSIGVEVIWIAKMEDIKLEGKRMELTSFQNALIHLNCNILFAYHTQLKTFFALRILRVMHRNVFEVSIECIQSGEMFLKIYNTDQLMPGHHVLNHREKMKHIKNCLAKKSVLEPTLSGLYQLKIDRRQIPDYLSIILNEQMYIQCHPIEWQVQLMLMIENNNFDFSQWMTLLNFTQQSKVFMLPEQLALQTLKEYQRISTEMRAIITEK
ncbi:competence protein CoiA [Macrococcus equi]|uniref:competence protein CoiA n=1 Tax=Macrococcus equi TaxID=3395462 RepID=UPI0039BE199F